MNDGIKIQSKNLLNKKIVVSYLNFVFQFMKNMRWHFGCTGWKLTRNFNQKKNLGVSQDLHYVTYAAGEGISLMSKWDIPHQLRKQDFSCDYIFLMGRQYITWTEGNFFLIKWREIALTLFLVRATSAVTSWRI